MNLQVFLDCISKKVLVLKQIGGSTPGPGPTPSTSLPEVTVYDDISGSYITLSTSYQFIRVFKNGILLANGENFDYTFSNDTITFDEPLSHDRIVVEGLK